MMSAMSNPTKPPTTNNPTQTQLTLPALFANAPVPSGTTKKLQFGQGVQRTIPQVVKQLEAAAAEQPQNVQACEEFNGPQEPMELDD